MKKTVYRRFGRPLVMVTSALTGACAGEFPFAPVGATSAGQTAAVADISAGNRLPGLGICDRLAAPQGSTLVLRAFGVGVQIYHWNGTSWTGPVPSATLYADAQLQGVVATHFAGPTWQSNSGGTVVGTVANRCTVDPASIPWVSLTAVANGAGIFQKVTFIQRLHTVGGIAPSVDGTVIGQEADVPYTADYLFYNAP